MTDVMEDWGGKPGSRDGENLSQQPHRTRDDVAGLQCSNAMGSLAPLEAPLQPADSRLLLQPRSQLLTRVQKIDVDYVYDNDPGANPLSNLRLPPSETTTEDLGES